MVTYPCESAPTSRASRASMLAFSRSPWAISTGQGRDERNALRERHHIVGLTAGGGEIAQRQRRQGQEGVDHYVAAVNGKPQREKSLHRSAWHSWTTRSGRGKSRSG